MVEFTDFVRQPFKIEAVQITDDNMDALAELLNSTVITTEDGTSQYISVNRKVVPQGSKAYVGWWVTIMGKKLRCYPNKIFTQQFTEMTDEWRSWFGPDEEEVTSESETAAILADPDAMAAIEEAEDVEGELGEEDPSPMAPSVASSTPEDPAVEEGDSGAESVPGTPEVSDAEKNLAEAVQNAHNAVDVDAQHEADTVEPYTGE